MLERPLCVVGDVHLGEAAREPVGVDLARLIARFPEHEVLLDGDTFDLSIEPASRPPEECVTRILRHHPEARAALASARVTFVAGNHDAAIAAPSVTAALRAELGADVPVAPWFVRRGSVHVEHGHLYDPDNAPTHPLARWTLATEPLGVALTRRFVAPTRSWEFFHGDETTPLAGLLRAFRLYGARAPLTVARYFATAAALVREAGHQPGVAEERATGARAVADFAREVGLDADALHELSLAAAGATHHRRGATFQRLYLDRSLASALLVLALGGAALGSGAGAGVAAVAASYLGFSVARGTNRYGGLLSRRLGDAAQRVRGLTGASLVVFGHTHRSAEHEGYLNPGSFAFPEGASRRYVLVERDGSARLAEL